ncbi:MAG TPA: hypothetical protein VMQ40_06610 [Acidimicrobiales bacterium]|jgi:aquaporin Z|nr:hypothetical protein [Acidimicrobiales bacterium]
MTRKLLAELLGMAVLVYVGCVTAARMFGFHLTDHSLAPGVVATALGPAVILGGTPRLQVWLFIVAPLIGGALAAVLYHAMDPETSAARKPVSTAEPAAGGELAQAR